MEAILYTTLSTSIRSFTYTPAFKCGRSTSAVFTLTRFTEAAYTVDSFMTLLKKINMLINVLNSTQDVAIDCQKRLLINHLHHYHLKGEKWFSTYQADPNKILPNFNIRTCSVRNLRMRFLARYSCFASIKKVT